MKKILIYIFAILFTANVFADTINLRWYDGDTQLSVPAASQSCTYGNTFSLPTQPTKNGYTFGGWRVVEVPSAYTKLEYLESTNTTAYIDTGIQFNSGNTYNITYSKGGGFNVIMGVQSSNDYLQGDDFTIVYCNSDTCVYSSRASGSTNSGFFGDTVYGVIHTVKYQQSSRTLLFDNANHWRNDWLTNSVIPYNIYLFLVNVAGNPGGSRRAYVRIYSYSVLNSQNIIIQNFIPVRRNSDNVVGMWDTISGTFFTNAGSGTFNTGPVVQ